MNLSETILRIRKEKKLSQCEFAKALGVNESTLSLIETGNRKPSINFLSKCSEALEVPLAVLLIGSLEEKDFPSFKRESFRVIKPALDSLINQLFS